MSRYIKKYKWLIVILPPAFVIICIIINFYSTNRFFSQNDLVVDIITFYWRIFIKWINLNIYNWGFFLSIFASWISAVIFGFVVPSPDKKTLKIVRVINETTKDTKKELTEIKQNIDKLIEKSNIGYKIIEKYIKELPIKEGKRETETMINEWYNVKKISTDEKDLLFSVIYVLFDNIEELSQKISDSRLEGEFKKAELLENIQKHFTEGNADKILNEYYLGKEKLTQQNIEILKKAIDATDILYAYKEEKELYTDLILLEPTSENYFNFAYLLQKLKYFENAISFYNKALVIYKELAKIKPEIYLPIIATISNNLGNIHSDKNEFNLAIDNYNVSLNTYYVLINDGLNNYLYDAALTLNNIGNLHKKINDNQEANEDFKSALIIFRKLVKKNRETYLSDLAACLTNHANVLRTFKENKQALKEYKEALKIRRDLAKCNSETSLSDLSFTLNNLGNLHLSIKEFPKAIEYYDEALRIRRDIALKNPRVYLDQVASTLNNFAALHSVRKEFRLTFEKYQESLNIYKQLSKDNPNIYQLYIDMILHNMELLHKM